MGHARIHGADGQFARVFERQIRGQRVEIAEEDEQGREGEGRPVNGAEKRRGFGVRHDRSRGRSQ